MKRILKQGNISKLVAHCFTCDTEFEYEAEDLVFIKPISMICVECPNCGTLIQHNGNLKSNITTESL